MKKSVSGVIILLLSLSGCFTGVENIGKISDKDVERVKADKKSKEELFLDTIRPQSFIYWKPGKQFVVSDDNFKLILDPSEDYDPANLKLKGTKVSFAGYKYVTHFDNSEDVVISFTDGVNVYKYNTGKTIDDLKEIRPEYAVPFIIDLDYISDVDAKLKGQTFYIKSPHWCAEGGNKVNGVQFVAVDIEKVTAGDMIYPFYVYFKCDGIRYYVPMSSSVSSIKNATFDKLFSFTDIRSRYGHINDENWKLITLCKVAIGMTKEECSLSLGKPKEIDRATTYGGLYERWSYDNGSYLIFENGLLQRYRK